MRAAARFCTKLPGCVALDKNQITRGKRANFALIIHMYSVSVFVDGGIYTGKAAVAWRKTHPQTVLVWSMRLDTNLQPRAGTSRSVWLLIIAAVAVKACDATDTPHHR